MYFKPKFCVESYLLVVVIYTFRKSLSSFRYSSHNLMIENGRHIGLERDLRKCVYCGNFIECEYHFTLMCPLYTYLRYKFIQKKLYLYTSMSEFHMLMAKTDPTTIRNLSMFIYFSFSIRNTALNNVYNCDNP